MSASLHPRSAAELGDALRSGLGQVRLCGTATHLTDPKTLVYMLGMEGELVELNVRTLKVKHLFDLTMELGTPGERSCHFKDC